jgi:choice-of-anchor A domain-containing protein
MSELYDCTGGLLCAQDYTLFLFGSYSGGLDIAGAVAVEEDLSLTGFSVGHGAPGGKNIVAGGALTLRSGTVHGDACWGDSEDVDETVNLTGSLLHIPGAIDFDACETTLCGASHAMLAAGANGSTSVIDMGSFSLVELTGSDPIVNIFEISGDDLSKARSVELSVPVTSSVVINITGTDVTLTMFEIMADPALPAGRVLLNLPEAETLTMSAFGFTGSILACQAAVTFSAGQVHGSIIAASLTGTGEMHLAPFGGCVIPPETCTPDCTDLVCGDDGCGGSCGVCDTGFECAVDQTTCDAVCIADCLAAECGTDFCGGSCGTCGAGESCSNDRTCDLDCVPSCDGALCGDDGCGGSCGACDQGLECSADQTECQVPCVPDCVGATCGTDFCGGTCGTCGAGETCSIDRFCEFL